MMTTNIIDIVQEELSTPSASPYSRVQFTPLHSLHQERYWVCWLEDDIDEETC